MRITAITCVKNEGPFLLEWIAYHRMIGVTDFLFYSNDCDDGTDTLLDALAAREVVTHLPNPAVGRAYQMEALKDAQRQAVVKQADWLWVADVDEFPVIHAKGSTLPALIEACGRPGAISLHFQFFANGGVARFEDRPVIAQFTKAHTPNLWGLEHDQEVKTLFRADLPIQYIGAHRPFLKQAAPWTDGSGRPVPAAFLQAKKPHQRAFPAFGARRFGTLNHYALRSLDSYLVKTDRGDVNRENRPFDTSYWSARNDNAYEDRSIHKYLPGLQKILARLHADPELGPLHRACVAAHRAKIEALSARPDFLALRQALLDAPTRDPAELALAQRLEVPA